MKLHKAKHRIHSLYQYTSSRHRWSDRSLWYSFCDVIADNVHSGIPVCINVLPEHVKVYVEQINKLNTIFKLRALACDDQRAVGVVLVVSMKHTTVIPQTVNPLQFGNLEQPQLLLT